jgi:acyl-CoA synthetase (AMP-forming)/AMP-acid ligase II
MHPGYYAQKFPDKPAVIMGSSGEIVTWSELDERSNRLAQLLWDAGLRRGDHVAIFMENQARNLEVYWAAFRSGLYLTTVNQFLSAGEAAYIVDDCGAQVFISSSALADVAQEILTKISGCPRRLMVNGQCEGFDSYEDAIAAFPNQPLEKPWRGDLMLYSSGTTGTPKGVISPLADQMVDEEYGLPQMLAGMFAIDENTIYLSPAPLCHGAPIRFSGAVHALGGTVVLMESFEAREALRCIEAHKVTHSQWVPTMFSRMLRLAKEDREAHDLSSHQVAIHAAAPCPPKVKHQMIDWWGPIVVEYYAGTEINGLTCISAEDWLTHEGSVGKPVLGTLHICDDDGKELPAGEEGLIYFELPQLPFSYHGDEKKTKGALHPEHDNWSALGDVGRMDEEGFLYLLDRKTFMIIAGGVNIYPAEIENLLVTHPEVIDAAVVGVPNEDFGEEVKAVVQLGENEEGSPELARELIEFCRERLANYKCPRSVDFEEELPRLPTGKLYKRLLRDRYWGKTDSKIVQ